LDFCERLSQLVDPRLLFSAVAREQHPGARTQCMAVSASSQHLPPTCLAQSIQKTDAVTTHS